MKRFLVFCLGILILTAAVGCGGDKSTYAADSPEGVAQAYYQALQENKPELAYAFLKDWSKSEDQYVQEKKSSGMMFKDFIVGKAEVVGNKATVPVKFQTGVSSMPEITLNIILEKDTDWMITSLGMGDMSGHEADGLPATGMPPVGDMGGVDGSVYGSNPHGPGGTIPLDQ